MNCLTCHENVIILTRFELLSKALLDCVTPNNNMH